MVYLKLLYLRSLKFNTYLKFLICLSKWSCIAKTVQFWVIIIFIVYIQNRQYLLAQHAHICLELEPSLKNLSNSSTHIQYANELWSSIVFLSNTIANKARDVFTDISINSAKTLTNDMSAIYLLESTNLKAIFNEFLKKRTVTKLI